MQFGSLIHVTELSTILWIMKKKLFGILAVMDVYYKKEISYVFNTTAFRFAISQSLFSSFDLDHGTDVLLRTITKTNPSSILDIGCGYGPLGIILSKQFPKASVLMVDRDLLAVRYTKINCLLNDVSNVEVLGSVGLENVGDRKFDLIVSNVPAKIGDDAITEEFILTPLKHLTADGELWIVVVNGLNRFIPKVGRQFNLRVQEVRKRAGHTVYLIRAKG